MEKKSIISVGLAMFTMLFGAGNVVYPLVLGVAAGSAVWFGFLGFMLTAVAVPVLGFIATLLCDGDYSKFLRYLGRLPGAFIAMCAMVLVGPFCAVPRCIDLSYSLMHEMLPGVTLVAFSLVAGLIIFACAIKRDAIVPLFGKLLGPIKIFLVAAIIIKGLLMPAQRASGGMQAGTALWAGIVDGYGTMDLLGTILFAGLIVASMFALKGGGLHVTEEKKKSVAVVGFKMMMVASGCLTALYLGFCLISSRFSALLVGVEPSDLFSVLAHHILGGWGAAVAAVVITLTCVTTAIVICAIFADYLRFRILRGAVSYEQALFMTTTTASVMTFFGFASIMAAVEPMIMIFYPLLIVLAAVIVLIKLFRPIKHTAFKAAQAETPATAVQGQLHMTEECDR